MDPHQLILQDALGCNWDTTSFWLFSDNVFSPFIYYSHTYPAAVCLLLAAIILPLGRKEPVNRSFFVLALSFAVWCLVDFYLWASADIPMLMFTWSIMGIIEYTMFAAAFFLVFHSFEKRSVPFSYVLIMFLASLPMLVFTPYSLPVFDYTNCERAAYEGFAFQYMYAVELLTIVILAVFAKMRLPQIEDVKKRRENLLLSIGVIVFLLLFNIGGIFGTITNDWDIAQYGLLGMPVMLVILGYIITKYQTFNIRMVSSAVFVLVLMVLLYFAIFF